MSIAQKIFLVLVLSLPFTYFPVIEVGCTLQTSYLFTVVLLWAYIAGGMRNRQLTFVNSPLVIPYYLFLLAVACSMVQSRFIPAGVKYYVHTNADVIAIQPYLRSVTQCLALGFMFFVYYLTTAVVTTKEMVRRVLLAWWAISVFVALYGIYSFIAPYAHLPGGALSRCEGAGFFTMNRIRAFNEEPIFLGAYLLTVMPVALSLVLAPGPLRRRSWLAAGLLVQFTALVLTFARGAWGAFGISMLVVLWYHRQLVRRHKFVVIACMILVGLCLEYAGRQLLHRSLMQYVIDRSLSVTWGIEDYSSRSRFETWMSALFIFVQHPLLGVGIGNFWFHYPSNVPGYHGEWFYWRGGMESTVNNLFLSFLTETGVVGTVALVYFFYVLVRSCTRAIRRSQPEGRALLIGYFAGAIGMLWMYQFISTFYFPYVWVFFGMAIAAGRIYANEND